MRIARDDASRRSLKPPPNYASRKVQFRLMMMIFAFGATVWMMNEARKPANWRWFTALDGPSEKASTQPAADPDTRVLERAQADRDPPGVIRVDDESTLGEAPSPPSAAADDPAELARLDAWRSALAALDMSERRQFSRLMLAARGRLKLATDEAPRHEAIVAKLSHEWNAYAQEAFQAVVEQRNDLTDEQKTTWLEVIQDLESYWESQLQEALTAIATGREPTPRQTELLAEAQGVIDQIDLAAVVDHALYRPQDEHAWFRLLERLEDSDPQAMQSLDVPLVGFVQLFEQPDVYRGKLVRISGQIRLVKLVEPPANALGIEDYYMFWIRPDGSNSPVVIYCLETPAGFPPVDRVGTELDERGSFIGYFFKQWVYPAGDGPRIAPVLLAKAPIWTAASDASDDRLLSTGTLVMIVCGTALLGIVVATTVYVSSRSKSSNRSPYNTSVQNAPEKLAVLEQQPAPPTVGEKLEQYMKGEIDESRGEST